MPPLKKNEKIMLVVIAAAAVAFLILDPYNLWREPAAETVAAKKDSKKNTSPVVSAAADTTWPFSQERITLNKWGRDPFVQARPDLDMDETISDLKLGVISIRGDDRMAMINSKPVRVGDRINGLRVDRIESGQVILSNSTLEYTLTWEK